MHTGNGDDREVEGEQSRIAVARKCSNSKFETSFTKNTYPLGEGSISGGIRADIEDNCTRKISFDSSVEAGNPSVDGPVKE